ncbi:unnamed protein product [Ceutorhynchus assimilis]|uniref:Major facilitator superfamily (MFS) profile domain-containing protein n=1 Tax=Ceutorhynchus assimilis TaxID=467358 RepID=A0A9N9QCV2_9CUCU|nr:unnamed protein product [Ceutorhynchus assimilis]
MTFLCKIPRGNPADFQTAISATKYGKFNLFLLLLLIPASLLVQIESSLISYIIPAATCDLNLNVSQKGLLNSMAFLGMLSTGFLWGFLLDTLGRRKVLRVGFLAEAVIVCGQGLSTNVAMLYIFKFLGGTLIGGVYVALATYLQEFHATELRGKIQMASGMIYAGANVLVPLLSSAILPLKINASLYILELHAWNILTLIGSLSALLSFIGIYFLPETPKFLMTSGKNDEALRVLRKMYRINTGNMEKSYPIDSLIQEIPDESELAANKKSCCEFLKSGWQQMRPLFGKQYRLQLMLVCLVQSFFGMGIHTFRSYLPQVFQATHEYEIAHNGTTPNLCSILDILRSNASSLLSEHEEVICVVNVENSSRVYLNSVIIASVALLNFAIVGFLISTFRRKVLLTILGLTAAISVNCLYFSQNTPTTLAVSSIYLSTIGVCFEIFITVVVVVFPTTLRAMAISLCLFITRLCTVAGTNILPVLVETGCVPPFICLGLVCLVAVLLSWFVPDTETEDMK